jgi:hypothetical protein
MDEYEFYIATVEIRTSLDSGGIQYLICELNSPQTQYT